jgi:hypothetical protein
VTVGELLLKLTGQSEGTTLDLICTCCDI